MGMRGAICNSRVIRSPLSLCEVATFSLVVLCTTGTCLAFTSSSRSASRCSTPGSSEGESVGESGRVSDVGTIRVHLAATVVQLVGGPLRLIHGAASRVVSVAPSPLLERCACYGADHGVDHP